MSTEYALTQEKLMIGVGFFEILIIALVCFIAVGPKQLPALLRKLAAFYRQFITLRDELRFQILSADEDLKKNINIVRAEKVLFDDPSKKPEKIIEPREQDHG